MSHIGEVNNNHTPIIRFGIVDRYLDISIIVFSLITVIGYVLISRYPKIFFKNALPTTGQPLTKKFWLVSIPFMAGIIGTFICTVSRIVRIYNVHKLNDLSTEHLNKERIQACKEFLESNGHTVIMRET